MVRPVSFRVRPIQNGSVSQDGIEVVWYSWDDGDNSTWEGETWAQNYNTGEGVTWDGQIPLNSDHFWG